jgi:hypothetical protein
MSGSSGRTSPSTAARRAPLAEFERVAAGHPVFRVEPRGRAAV